MRRSCADIARLDAALVAHSLRWSDEQDEAEEHKDEHDPRGFARPGAPTPMVNAMSRVIDFMQARGLLDLAALKKLRLLISAEHDVIARIYQMYEQNDDVEALQKRLLHVAHSLAEDSSSELGKEVELYFQLTQLVRTKLRSRRSAGVVEGSTLLNAARRAGLLGWRGCPMMMTLFSPCIELRRELKRDVRPDWSAVAVSARGARMKQLLRERAIVCAAACRRARGKLLPDEVLQLIVEFATSLDDALPASDKHTLCDCAALHRPRLTWLAAARDSSSEHFAVCRQCGRLCQFEAPLELTYRLQRLRLRARLASPMEQTWCALCHFKDTVILRRARDARAEAGLVVRHVHDAADAAVARRSNA